MGICESYSDKGMRLTKLHNKSKGNRFQEEASEHFTVSRSNVHILAGIV